MKISVNVKTAKDLEAMLKTSGLYYCNGKPRFTTIACEKIMELWPDEDEVPIALLARCFCEYTPAEIMDTYNDINGFLDFNELREEEAFVLLKNGNWLCVI